MSRENKSTGTDRRILRTERAVLAAAKDLFERQGYAKTTMGQIAQQADCAERTLFLRFSSKADLLKRGMGNSEACRIVGISRSSGTRWRHGHSVVLKSGDVTKYAPISHRMPVVISARFLSESERITIADLPHARRSIRAIAGELGRSPSTVSREIRRKIHEVLATTVRGRPTFRVGGAPVRVWTRGSG